MNKFLLAIAAAIGMWFISTAAAGAVMGVVSAVVGIPEAVPPLAVPAVVIVAGLYASYRAFSGVSA